MGFMVVKTGTQLVWTVATCNLMDAQKDDCPSDLLIVCKIITPPKIYCRGR